MAVAGRSPERHPDHGCGSLDQAWTVTLAGMVGGDRVAGRVWRKGAYVTDAVPGRITRIEAMPDLTGRGDRP